MPIFEWRLMVLAPLVSVLTAAVCLGGSGELVKKKASELRAINEQVAQQAAPDGLQEGNVVEVKATLRVERVPGQEPVVRDLNVERLTVSAPVTGSPAGQPQPVVGAGKIRLLGTNEKTATAERQAGFREERLDVPAVP